MVFEKWHVFFHYTIACSDGCGWGSFSSFSEIGVFLLYVPDASGIVVSYFWITFLYVSDRCSTVVSFPTLHLSLFQMDASFVVVVFRECPDFFHVTFLPGSDWCGLVSSSWPSERIMFSFILHSSLVQMDAAEFLHRGLQNVSCFLSFHILPCFRWTRLSFFVVAFRTYNVFFHVMFLPVSGGCGRVSSLRISERIMFSFMLHSSLFQMDAAEFLCRGFQNISCFLSFYIPPWFRRMWLSFVDVGFRMYHVLFHFTFLPGVNGFGLVSSSWPSERIMVSFILHSSLVQTDVAELCRRGVQNVSCFLLFYIPPWFRWMWLSFIVVAFRTYHVFFYVTFLLVSNGCNWVLLSWPLERIMFSFISHSSLVQMDVA